MRLMKEWFRGIRRRERRLAEPRVTQQTALELRDVLNERVGVFSIIHTPDKEYVINPKNGRTRAIQLVPSPGDTTVIEYSVKDESTDLEPTKLSFILEPDTIPDFSRGITLDNLKTLYDLTDQAFEPDSPGSVVMETPSEKEISALIPEIRSGEIEPLVPDSETMEEIKTTLAEIRSLLGQSRSQDALSSFPNLETIPITEGTITMIKETVIGRTDNHPLSVITTDENVYLTSITPDQSKLSITKLPLPSNRTTILYLHTSERPHELNKFIFEANLDEIPDFSNEVILETLRRLSQQLVANSAKEVIEMGIGQHYDIDPELRGLLSSPSTSEQEGLHLLSHLRSGEVRRIA